MILYIVQKLHWEYNDQFYCLADDTPVKAFARKQDAEDFRLQQEREARVGWLGNTGCLGENGDCDEPDAFFEVVALELEP